MKKFLCFLLAFAASFVLVSCNSEIHKVSFYKVDVVNGETLVYCVNVLDGKTVPGGVFQKLEDEHHIADWTKDEVGGEPFDKNEPVFCDLNLYAQESCIASGTMITMADGSTRPVENLEIGDMIKTFDHDSGKISSAPVYDILRTENIKGAVELIFSDGSGVTIVNEHGFFNEEENKYVFINLSNIDKFLNKSFYNADSGSFVELTGYNLLEETTDAYSIVSAVHLNHVSGGMLSMTNGVMKVVCNIFEFEENRSLRINQQKKDEDIQKYGLISPEDLKYYSLEDYEAFNIKYLKIAVGKGLISQERLDFLAGILSEM